MCGMHKSVGTAERCNLLMTGRCPFAVSEPRAFWGVVSGQKGLHVWSDQTCLFFQPGVNIQSLISYENESTTSLLKQCTFWLHFENKIFLKYIGWFNTAVFIIQCLLASIVLSLTIRKSKNNTITYRIQISHLWVEFLCYFKDFIILKFYTYIQREREIDCLCFFFLFSPKLLYTFKHTLIHLEVFSILICHFCISAIFF